MFSLTVKQIKAAWKSLKDKYRKEKAIVCTPKSGSGASDKGKKVWQFYEKMTFMAPFVSTKS